MAPRPWALLVGAWSITACIVALGAATAALLDLPLSALLRDAVPVIDEEVCTGGECLLAGAISNLVVIAWLVSGLICLRTGRRAIDRDHRLLLIGGGLLTIVLGLDDLLMLHERWVPALLPAGETLLLAGYAAASVAFVLLSRRLLPETHVEALAAALVLLATSVLVDVALSDAFVIEDITKAFGVAAWAAYFIGTALGVSGASRERRSNA